MLVTGAARGIGKSIVEHLCARGWNVIAGVRNQQDAEAVTKLDPQRVSAVILDVTSADDIAALDRSLPERLDAIVNNAGVAVSGAMETLRPEEWRKQLEVNVIGALAITQAVIPGCGSPAAASRSSPAPAVDSHCRRWAPTRRASDDAAEQPSHTRTRPPAAPGVRPALGVAAFVKRSLSAPAGFFACEAAGLQWLSSAEDGVPCARVIECDDVSLTVERLEAAGPTRAAAHEFGRRLARTHDAGADAFGSPPSGWTGPGYFGPLHDPLPMSLTGHRRWGAFYARERLAPMAERAARRLSSSTCEAVGEVITRCEAGDFDDDDPPARLHGDLWSGNVMWTPDGVVLIDPAAHGGHRETDIAMLVLFGCPFLDAVLDGYQSQRPLRDGWRERVGLHQLYPLLAHVVLFGGGYAHQTSAAAAQALQ